jgi:cytochrome c
VQWSDDYDFKNCGGDTVNVSAGARLFHVCALLSLLALALFFPYLWFGVVPFSPDTEVSQAEIDRLLAGIDVPNFYAAPLLAISDEELAAQKEAFTWCRFCHTLEQGGENRVGPNLHRILGQPAAVVAGFPYSRALIRARENGLIWTPENMANFIADPHGMIPGNRMRYPPMLFFETSPEKERMMLEYLLRMTR